MTRWLTDYQGRKVRLTDERRQHILEHPEMVALARALGKVLKQPEMVVQSQSDPEVRLFYRLLERTALGRKWLCVVVKYRLVDAFVLTAYLTDKPKKEVRIWPDK